MILKHRENLFYFWSIVFLIGNISFEFVAADGDIGCLFAESLCKEHLEWCYDDFAFGKCLPQYGLEPEELFREPLDEKQTAILATSLEELQNADLGWKHPFTQCRMQEILFALRTNSNLQTDMCNNLLSGDKVFDGQNPLAFVSFTPSNEDYADELYSPPKKKQEENLNNFVHSENKNIENSDNPRVNKFEAPSNNDFQTLMQDIKHRIELRRMLDTKYHEDNNNDYDKDGNERIMKKSDMLLSEAEQAILNKMTPPSTLKEYQIPTTSFREIAIAEDPSIEAIDDNINNKNNNNNNYFYRKFNNYQNRPLHREENMFENLKNNNMLLEDTDANDGVYTEGGLVYVPNSDIQNYSNDNKEKARTLLANMLGFTRHERLDVKKPGPPAAPPSSQVITNVFEKNFKPDSVKNETASIIKKQKIISFDHAAEDHAPYSVDTDYAHVIVKNPLDKWGDGARIVTAIGEMLNMDKYLTHYRVDRHEVSFFVEENPEKKTAADIAKSINDNRFKANLSRRLGVIVIRAGIGDKTKEIDFDSVHLAKLEQADDAPDVTHVMAYMFAGAGVAAFIVIVITLILIKKNDKKRDKLGGLHAAVSGTETCTKDYQELCRARMSGKNNTVEQPVNRITSLPKESDARPPSSRSSTSSWSEEPALTNMDISTGHMVLSYMEDHLRNKGRLQREWEALCRYEAEPGARDVALQPQCVALNRPDAPLPFDHSRVVLNHLANAESLDYINASTITDHDPRAPAYVAAQAPLPTTLAHFWQMVWEQGAVVLVALCRLQENGEISCARYWPEEGSEVYHIYEVHLVSEHTWCDDYLVRSFYLKNLRTSETRTVTQFHFLSWPQSGVPTTAKALLEFRRKVNKSYRGRSCPIVVHSSIGAGRTGAYILLDLVLGRMNKGAREIDIAATLEHLRDQRAGLVATRQQFEFVLMAVAEEVHAILKALPQTIQNEKRDFEKEINMTKENEKEKQDKNKPSTVKN